jgi:hypothetical protein
LISRDEWDLASRTTKQFYLENFRETILNWISEKETEILDVLDKKKYSVGSKSFEASVQKRNQLEMAINESRRKYDGAVDLATLDQICLWGFNRKFPERNTDEVVKVTKKAFESLDKEDCYSAVFELMKIRNVGISRASKIIGLSNQEKLCIYDSRVGHALRDLKKNGIKLVKCPPDQGYKRDYDLTTKSGWALNYERLIWTIEIIQNYLKTRNRSLRAADVEIALFVLGED